VGATQTVGTSSVTTAAPRTVWAGVYTDEQAIRGATAYQTFCAKCHLENLKGNDMAPSLAGDDFLQAWKGKSVRALYSLILSTMPSDNPGTLASQEVLDIVAYVLKSNEFPSGSEALGSADEAQQIQITDQKSP
jgi:cytochrome c